MLKEDDFLYSETVYQPIVEFLMIYPEISQSVPTLTIMWNRFL